MVNSFDYLNNSMPNNWSFGSYKQGPETYTYTGNEKLRYNPMSSKSNIVDALGSFGLGFMNTNQQRQNQPTYYVNANYKGEGRADTGLGTIGFDKDRANYDSSRFDKNTLGGLLSAHADRARKYTTDYDWNTPINPLPTSNQLMEALNNMFGSGYIGNINTGNYSSGIYDNVYNPVYYPNSIYDKWGV